MVTEQQKAYDLLKAHQYLYYVKGTPKIADYRYDLMESRYEHDWDAELPVGSDCLADYTADQIVLAESL